jgi:hypothetical protein
VVPVVLSLTVSGTASAADYTGVTTSLTFAVGETEKVVRLMPVDDALIEGNEQVIYRPGHRFGIFD